METYKVQFSYHIATRYQVKLEAKNQEDAEEIVKSNAFEYANKEFEIDSEELAVEILH